MRDRRRSSRQHRRQPALECFERRELLSGFSAAMAGARPTPLVSAAALGNSPAPEVLATPPPPFTPGAGVPTPHEVARQRFRATFSGPVIQGPGRYSDQARTLYFRGAGSSNQFLHGTYQMAIVFPTDPTQPIVGGVYMQDRNANSGGQVGFNLTIDPSSIDRFGRPTHATFTDNQDVYSGIYYAQLSQGDVQIRYFGQQAAVLFNGQMYTSGLTGVFRNTDLYFHH